MNTILEVRSVTETYNRYAKNESEALRGTSLEIHEGDFICIMGPSDSGKSILTNNLSTVDTSAKRKVRINDIDVYGILESQTGKFRYENLGFIFQSFNLMNTPALKGNIALPLTLPSISKGKIGIRIQ